MAKLNAQVLARELKAPVALMSREGAAHRLGGVSTRTVDRMIKAGTLPKVQVGRRVMLPVAAVEALISGSGETAAP
jgi:excisionase family DNA binding protein